MNSVIRPLLLTIAASLLLPGMAGGQSATSGRVAPRPAATPVAEAGQYTLDVSVEGPADQTIQAGRPVRLRVKVKVTRTGTGAVTATSPFDDAPVAFEWQLASPPPGYVLADWIDSDGRSVIFADPKPGRYDFMVSAAMWTGGPTPLLKTTTYSLTNAGETPPSDPPPPEPVPPELPPTTPTPPVDPPETPVPQPTEFVRAVRDAVVRLVPEKCRWRGLLLAKTYAAAATGLEKSDAIDIEAELKARKASNDATLEADRPMWDGFFVWLADELKLRYATGQMKTGQAVAKVWSEISLGLLLAGGAK